METQFYVAISMKTARGLEPFAQFFLGNDRERANDIFERLERIQEVRECNILFFEFMETRNGLPVNLDVISCTLDQLAVNCRTISKELFKFENLENF